MSLQGDLSTLDLAGLLQNLETHGKSGLLSVDGAAGTTQLYFDAGQISLLAFEGRPSLMAVLAASGAITAEEREAAGKKRRRAKKSLGEVLVAAGAIEHGQLVEVATARLLDEACELVSTGSGAFTFTEGAIPARVFDPEERRLGMRLPAGPLLMESARRDDHWRLIRERVPSDSAHYVVQRAPQTGASTSELLPHLLERLDGTRSVAEAMACFPHRRFDAYQLLADLVESRAVREIAPAELAKVAERLARHNRERALVLLERGLVAQPRNHELLVVKATLSETVGELEDASEALKMLVHLHLEAGERDEARARLDQLKELSPSDPAVWARSFALALEEERQADAQREGRRLAELYREPGLFKKACGVLERLVALDGSSWELTRELARTRADAGEAEAAVRGLERFGEERLTNGEYPLALHVYEEILSIDPKNARAKDTIELIQSGELERRRARRRRVIRRLSLAACAVALVGWLAYEGRARAAYLETTRAIGRERLIEATRYEEAIRRFEAVRADYPLATSAWIDARLVIADLRARQRED